MSRPEQDLTENQFNSCKRQVNIKVVVNGFIHSLHSLSVERASLNQASYSQREFDSSSSDSASWSRDVLALVWVVFCGACGLRTLCWGVHAILQSFHQASTVCSGAKRVRNGPSARISQRSFSVSSWSHVLRSVLISFREQNIPSTLPFKTGRWKHNSLRTKTFFYMLASGQTCNLCDTLWYSSLSIISSWRTRRLIPEASCGSLKVFAMISTATESWLNDLSLEQSSKSLAVSPDETTCRQVWVSRKPKIALEKFDVWLLQPFLRIFLKSSYVS